MKFKKFLSALVHLYTASGAFLAFGAMLFVSKGRFEEAFLLLMIALFVDYSDGALARLIDIKGVMPLIDGVTLDHIVDFVTSAFLPAFILWEANLLPAPPMLWVILILATTLYRFTKTFNPWLGQGFFAGIPSPWLSLSYYVYFYRLDYNGVACLIIVLVTLTFMPLKFVHIARFKKFRLVYVATLGAWWALYLGITQGWIDDWRFWLNVSLIFPIFYISSSWYFGARIASNEYKTT